MTWTMLNTDATTLFDAGDSGPEGVLWSRSICGVPIETSGHDLNHSLTVLYDLGLHSAVRDVLTKADHTWADHRCLADFYAGYGMLDSLAHLLERSPQACTYVLALPSSKDADVDEKIIRAQDMARTSLAKRYAIEAIGEMEIL